MALHIENRPLQFDDFIGNEKTVSVLKQTLKRPDRPHSYLFAGNSGCGKTTLARICVTELGINEWDMMEMNMANTRGIDTARDVLEKMNYSAMMGGAKAYIMDEFHMATKEFQNAMLKALEDTPDHVYFFLVTTEPEKIIKTVLNRLTKFTVTTLSDSQILAILKKVKSKFTEKTLSYIAEQSKGTPREALLLLDQVQEMAEEDVQRFIETREEEQQAVVDLCRRMLRQGVEWKHLTSILKNLTEDTETIRKIVLGYMNSVLLSSGNEKAALIIENFEKPFYDSGRAGLSLAVFKSIL